MQSSTSDPAAISTANAGTGRRWCAVEAHRLGNQAPDLLRRLDQITVGEMGIARSGLMTMVTEQVAQQRQVFTRHDGMARRRVAEVVQPDLAEIGVVADRLSAVGDVVRDIATRVRREQASIRIARSGQRVDHGPRGLAERHAARASLGVAQGDGVLPDVAPAEIENFAPAAPCERQQPDRRDGLGPLVLAGVERAPEPGELVGVEESGRCCASGSS